MWRSVRGSRPSSAFFRSSNCSRCASQKMLLLHRNPALSLKAHIEIFDPIACFTKEMHVKFECFLTGEACIRTLKDFHFDV